MSKEANKNDKDHPVNTGASGHVDRQGRVAVGRGKPEWTRGLRELYDSVVDEPLPDTFKDLLARLDGDPK
ncbi:MAG: NepR family anti-sigma factor [Caenibius sp.]